MSPYCAQERTFFALAKHISDTVRGWDEEIEAWMTDQYDSLEYTCGSERNLVKAMYRFVTNVNAHFNLVELECAADNKFTRDDLLELFVKKVFLPSLHPKEVTRGTV